MNILEDITEKYPTFTRQGRRLADFIFSCPTEISYLSITVLAERSGVSEATITRFCHQMGLSGYNEFKLALARASHTTDMGDPSGSQQPIASGDSLEAIFHKLHMLHTISLGETLERLDTESVERAAALLSASEKVYCMGNGGSMVTAMEAWARFCTVTSKFIHITESHMQVITTALATPSDCILFFSYSGSTRDMEDLLTLAKERKIPIILVTHFPRSAAARLADITLLCGYNESPLQSGSIAAKIGQMFIIECLYYAFCKQNPEQTAADRECTAQAITRKLL